MFVMGLLSTHDAFALRAADQLANNYEEIWQRFLI